MDDKRLLSMLEETAQRLGISVRYERLEGTEVPPRDGLCRVREEYLLFIDRRRPPKEKIRILTEAIAAMDAEATYLAPVVRELVEGLRNKGVPPKKKPVQPQKLTLDNKAV